MSPTLLSRRDWLRLGAAGFIGGSMSGWFPVLAQEAAKDPRRHKACILLWMSGGPSQLDTFDPKPGHENGGEFASIETAVPGIQICEHLPQVAQRMQEMAIIRSMSTKEGDHTRATFLAHTGYLPQGPIRYPTMGALLSKELGPDDAELPNFVSIAPNRFISPGAFGPGFLGPSYAPLIVGGSGLTPGAGMTEGGSLEVRNIERPAGVSERQLDGRLGLLESLQSGFAERRPDVTVLSHAEAYNKAVRMMRSPAVGAFNLDDEKDAVRDRYGRNPFGQGCLLARRLVERGVPFIEVSLNGVEGSGIGWDTHQDNFNGVRSLCEVLDPAWATLLDDLKTRGLLESTLVIWMGEFGRTPQIAADRTGRDHFPAAWSTVLAGGGIRGGQVIGRTSADGMQVEDRPVSMPDYFATICLALGLDPDTQNISNVGRPIRLADPEAEPVRELLT